MVSSLREKVISGGLWNMIEKLGTSLLLFIANLVLTRILAPSDFGCIGILLVFISISDAIVDGGFGAALIQKKEVTPEDYSTIFVWNLIISIILYFILFITSPIIANFYKIDLLNDVLRIQGVVLFFNGLSLVQKTILTKKLNFKKLAKIQLSANLTGTLVAILCAINGLGIWSLVIKFILTSIIRCILLWFSSFWYPSFYFSLKAFKKLFKFGSFVFLTSIINTLYQNLLSIILGKQFSPSVLGYFTQARKLEDIPRQTLSSVINNVTFPAFSTMQNERTKLREVVRESLSFLSFINCTLSILMIIVAKPLIVLLFTEKWLPAVPFFQIICIYGLFLTIIELYHNILKSTGNSNILFSTVLIRRVIGICLIIGGITGGIKGILAAYILSQIISFIIVAIPLNKLINYSILSQIIDIIPNFILTFIIGFIVYYAFQKVSLTNNFSLIISESIVYIALILLLSRAFKMRGLFLFNKIVIPTLKKIHKR